MIAKSKYFHFSLQSSFFIRKKNSSIYLFPALFLFVVYNLTISPTVYWRDSPEFVNTAFSFGIAHPAGFPVYSTISKIFTLLPLSNIAMRVNYVSLFFAVLACCIILYIILDLINICFKEESNFQKYLSAMLGILFLGGATSYWWIATIAEVYSMNCFFLSLFLLAAIKWYQSRYPKFLFLASFLFGISIAVYGANILFVPALVIFYFLTTDKKNLNYLFLAVLFFLLGYSSNLYLPVRSITDPVFDWGNPETFGQFIAHITDKKDSAVRFSGAKNLTLLFVNIKKFAQITITEITLIGSFLTIIGAFQHFKEDKKSFFLLASISFIHTAFFLTSLSEIAKNGSFFLPSFIIFTCWIGLGIYVLISQASSQAIIVLRYKNVILPIIVSFIVFLFVNNFSDNNKSSFYLSRDHAKKMYVNVDQNALLFTSIYGFFFRYFKDVENLRSDISVILLSDIVRPDIFNQVVPKRFPLLEFPDIESKRENLHEYVQLLILKNIKFLPIYMEINNRFLKYNYQYLIPENSFLMRISKHKVDKIPNSTLNNFILLLKDLIEHELNDEHFFQDQKMGVRSYYETSLVHFADYLRYRKRYHYAVFLLEFAKTIVEPNNTEVSTRLGMIYLEMGNHSKAERIFTFLLEEDKKSFTNNYNLASLYLRKNELDKSKKYLKKAIEINNDAFETYFLSGLIYAAEGKFDESLKEINFAISKTKFIPDKRKMQNALEFINNLKINKQGKKMEEGEFVKLIYPDSSKTAITQNIEQ